MKFITAEITNKEHLNAIEKLVGEYIRYSVAKSQEATAIEMDAGNMLRNFMGSIEQYSPAHRGGVTLLIENDQFIGVGAYHALDDTAVELKRVFIQPQFRGNGWGEQIINEMSDNAKERDYHWVKIESGYYLNAAYEMYKKIGFTETCSYCGAECEHEKLDQLYYMKYDLRS